VAAFGGGWKKIKMAEIKFRPNRKIFVFGGHFVPWLPWQWPHTTVDIHTKFHEAWWKESKFFLNPPFFASYIWYISRRLQNGNQWNFTGMLSTMSRCADYFRNFQNGCHCHGNDQNAKKLKNVTMVTAVILNLFNPQKLSHTMVDIPTMFHEVWVCYGARNWMKLSRNFVWHVYT
jgi:hypothetical protein